MTKEPTEAQIKEACEALGWNYPPSTSLRPVVRVVARLIAQRDAERAEHEAFRQRVSDISRQADSFLEELGARPSFEIRQLLHTLILPDPTPTPEQVLVEITRDMTGHWVDPKRIADHLQSELAKRGHHVAPIKDEG